MRNKFFIFNKNNFLLSNLIISLFFISGFVLYSLNNKLLNYLSFFVLYISSSILFLYLYFIFKNILKSLLFFSFITSLFTWALNLFNITYLPFYRISLFLSFLLFLFNFVFKKGKIFNLNKLINNNYLYKISLISLFIFFIYTFLSIVFLKKFEIWNYKYILFLFQDLIITILILFNIEKKEIEIFFNILLYIPLIVIIGISLIEIVLHIHLPYRRNIPSYIPTAFYYDQNNLAFTLVLFIPFLTLNIKNNNRKFSILNNILLISTITIIVITSSRFSLIALFFYFLISIFNKSLKENIINFLAIFIILLFYFILINYDFLKLFNFLSFKINSFLANGLKESSANIRLTLYKLGLKELINTPLGHGPGEAENFYKQYISLTRGITNPHSLIIEIIVNFGVIGFVSFITFYLTIFLNLSLKYFKRKNNDTYRFSDKSNSLIIDNKLQQDKNILFSFILYMVLYFIVSFNASGNIYGIVFPWILFGFVLVILKK